jgi:hypothetical protein
MRFNLPHKFLDEFEEGADLGIGHGDSNEVIEPQPWEPSLGELRESMSAMEGRFGERLSPLQQQLQGIQSALGKQTAVEVPDDLVAKFDALFAGYDPKFEGVGALLKELLTSSVKQRDLSPEALQPLLDPILSERDYKHAERWLDTVTPSFAFDMADFDEEGWHEKPRTETHKLFLKWWDRADQATRSVLTARRQDGRVADPYAYGQAFKSFDSFYRKQTASANESAGASAARLAGATPVRSTGRSSSSGSQLRTEADGFASVFKQAS